MRVEPAGRAGRVRPLLALVLAWLAGSPPAAAAEAAARPEALRFPAPSWRLPQAEPLRHRLSNGVPVYLVSDRTLPLVEVVVALPAGAELDPPERPGLASLAAALVRRGGAGPWSADELDRRFDALGAEASSAAGTLRAGATLDCLSRVLPEALALFGGMLREPRFEEARLESLRGNLRTSFARRNDDPLAVLEREWRWLVFGPRHPQSRELAWDEARALGREELLEFHRRHWRPERLVVAASGDVDAATLLPLLERELAGRPAEESPIAATSEPRPPPPHAVAPGLYHLERDLPQAKIALGHRGVKRRGWDDPDAFALVLMNEVLGGSGPVSRLRASLRGREGIAYRAGSRFDIGLLWEGDFQVLLEVEGARAGRAVELALAEVARLRRETVPQAELELARRALTDGLPLLFDRPEETAGRYAEDELLGRPHAYWTSYAARLRALTSQEVLRAARRHLQPDALIVLVVGPREAAARVSDALGLPIAPLPGRDPLSLRPRSPAADSRP
jgi:zinc protease